MTSALGDVKRAKGETVIKQVSGRKSQEGAAPWLLFVRRQEYQLACKRAEASNSNKIFPRITGRVYARWLIALLITMTLADRQRVFVTGMRLCVCVEGGGVECTGLVERVPGYYRGVCVDNIAASGGSEREQGEGKC